MQRKTLKICAATMAAALALGVCGCAKKTNIVYYDGIGGGYDTDLFYRNDITALGADPGCIYIEDGGEYDGYFFMYPTSDFTTDCRGIVGYKSKDLHHWEMVGEVFSPEKDSYITDNIWAPEIIYDGEALQAEYGLSEDGAAKGVYYLFFNSNDCFNTGVENAELVFDTYADKAKYEEIGSAEYSETWVDEIEKYYEFYRIAAVDESETKTKYFERYGIVGFYEKYIRAEIDKESELYKEKSVEAILEQLVLYRNIRGRANSNREAVRSIYRNLAATPKTILNDYCIGVAVSASPAGPFTQYTRVGEAVKEGQRTITAGTPFLSSEDMTDYAHGNSLLRSDEAGFAMIDASPFVDPKTGEKYLYFVRRHCGDEPNETNFICGIKMGERWTDDPEWETLTRLTQCNVREVGGEEPSDTEDVSGGNRINEGPNMYYDAVSGQYILTYSVNKLTNRSYSVSQALSGSPLGSFTKVKKEDGGYILYADGRTCVSGAGHHAIVRCKEKLYIVYHAHLNSQAGTGQRGIAADELYLATNSKGQRVLQANGPTYCPQPLMESALGYRNIAGEATVSATNCNSADIPLLTDGAIPVFSFIDFTKEFQAKKGKTTITLQFGDYRPVRAVLIYNSKSYETAFREITAIEMTYQGEKKKQKATIANLRFDAESYISDLNIMSQCSAAIAEFEELNVKEIKITIKSDRPVGIPEICVLGK